MFRKGICLLLGTFLALGMTASVSGCKKSRHKENSTLKLTFRGEKTGALQEGVVVVLYGTDNVTPEAVKVTGADGLADFGNIGRTTATCTWAYKFTEDLVEQRRLHTVIEGPVLKETIYIEEAKEAEIPTLVNLEITGIPDSEEIILAYQVGQSGWIIGGPRAEVIVPDIPILDANKDEDGKITFLAAVFNFYGDMVRYGFLSGQTVTPGAIYTVALTRAPETLVWTATDLVQIVELGYRYKGSEYDVGFEEYTRARSAKSDSLEYAKQMPLDWSIAYAQTPDVFDPAGGTQRASSYAYHGYLPSHLNFDIPDYAFDSVDFKGSTKVWSWKLNGISPKDIIRWEFFQFGIDNLVNWVIDVPPDKTDFTVPTLPATPSNIDWFEWSNEYAGQLSIADNSRASGFKDFVRKSAGASDTLDNGNWKYGFYISPPAAAEEKTAKVPRRPFRR